MLLPLVGLQATSARDKGLALVLKQSSKENKAMLKQQKSIKNSYMDKLSLEIDEQDNFMTEVESEFVEIN
jgi:hypothetical protein